LVDSPGNPQRNLPLLNSTAPKRLPLLDLLSDAQRQLEICNACRYCEGYCAVFPALERRTAFTTGDIQFIANLCHDCRACYYACPFAPPHEFGVNLPEVLSAVRVETYQQYAAPAVLARMARNAVRSVIALSLLGILAVVSLVILFSDPVRLVEQQLGPGSFYRVVPHLAMAIPALAITIYGFTVFLLGGRRFWRDTGGSVRSMADLRSVGTALKQAFSLRYLKGGGDGCYYPKDRPSGARRLLHSLVFYGFILAFASTTIAAIEQEILGILPPYPLISLPVITGSIGGVFMIIGCSGLMAMKLRSDQAPATRVMRSMDFAFLGVLNAASITGMLVLVFRDAAIMGLLVALHLGILSGLYVTAPYSKFAHVVYRVAALAQDRVEESRERGAALVSPGAEEST
jgi:citrate/tricarballylate utilization protein